MYSEDGYLGCQAEVEELKCLNNSLNEKVLDQVNDSQELVMLNSFAKEASEYHFKKCLQERISDIASWHWVLEDLTKRLDESIAALKYEHNALRVIVQRLENEINEHSREATRPGALKPSSDNVEEAILQEYNFLREEKQKFEKMIPDLEKKTEALEKTKKRIDTDLFKKQEALSVENTCSKIDVNTLCNNQFRKRKKRRFSPLSRWENRCASLKKSGLKALRDAIIVRQQVRGARVYLSIAAQAYAARVDSALRKRLHVNSVKLQELQWQREEAIRDIKSLDEELITAEQNLLDTMEQERVVEARIADRTLRPPGEFTRDEVDKQLRDELTRIRHFTKHLRSNIDRITSLQNNLSDTITRIDCCAEDLSQVVRLDKDRMRSRLGEDTKCDSETSSSLPPLPNVTLTCQQSSNSQGIPLTAIIEEDEDDYPFDN